MALGEGDYRYEVVPGWAKLPEGWVFTQVADVAVDSEGRIYAFTRGRHPVIVFNQAGEFLTSWGYGECGDFPDRIGQPHGIFIDRNDNVYLVDSYQHVVRQYSRLGEMQREWGTPGEPQTTFYRRQFNMPTGAVIGPDGSMYVADGYGNRCVHKYSREGKHLLTWGDGGDGPGQFAVVHNIGCDRTGRVIVCDRENDRVQIFDPDGAFIEAWTDVVKPADVWVTEDNVIYLVEQGLGGRVGVWSPEGKLLSRFSGPDVQSSHGVCVDIEGSIYVAEIGVGDRGQRLQKYIRV